MLNAKRLLQRKVTIPISEFDISLDELNCLNGVLNLKTGELLPHHYKHRFTYCLPVKYNPNATSELWQTWLLDTVGNKQDIVDFLQLALGYSLSGRTQEELMFYIWGPARGGKGVFTETIISLLGKRPLATEVDIELFMTKESNSGRANFSLAALKAARFVAASESKENEWLNAKRIKQWTGNNFVTAAHKYGHDFTYSPQFKIWLTSNFPPQMNADDDAAWGRIKIIEFPNSHLGHEDKTLKSRMLEPNNLEGILAWMVKGAIEWYKLGSAGLKPPQTIINSTKDARDDVDWVSIWIQEDIILTDNSKNKITSADYYQEYKDWCILNGVSTKGIRALNRSLKQSGYDVNVPASVNGHTKRCWVGAKLTGPAKIIASLKGKPLMEDEE
jgi:putative DNA primase/helicase